MKYTIITACKNEEKNLHDLKEDILNQTLEPRYWLLGDDQSTDNTKEIMKEFSNDIEFVDYTDVNIDSSGFDYGFRRLHKVRDFLVQKLNLDNYDYVALMDADVHLPENYFETLVEEIKKSNIAAISGEKIENGKTVDLHRPSAGAILIDSDCLKSVSGWYGHTGTLLRFIDNGWECGISSKTNYNHKRDVHNRKTDFDLGRNQYYEGLPFYRVFLRGLFKSSISLRELIGGYFAEDEVRSEKDVEFYRKDSRRWIKRKIQSILGFK